MSESKTSLTTEVLTPAGYERLTDRREQRNLRLGKEQSIELVVGKNHKIKLSRGKDEVVRFSVKDFKLPDARNERDDSEQAYELQLIAGEQVVIERTEKKKLTGIRVEKGEGINDSVRYIYFPNNATNLQSEQIDFTDLEEGSNNGYLISINKCVSDYNIINIDIKNYDSNFGIAVPMQQAEQDQLPKEDIMEKIDVWRRLAVAESAESQSLLADELMAMAGDPEIKVVYDNFMKQDGAAKESGMIIALVAYLYKNQLETMGKEKFVAMVKGIKAAIAIGS